MMGTHQRVGLDSPVQRIAGLTPVIKLLYEMCSNNGLEERISRLKYQVMDLVWNCKIKEFIVQTLKGEKEVRQGAKNTLMGGVRFHVDFGLTSLPSIIFWSFVSPVHFFVLLSTHLYLLFWSRVSTPPHFFGHPSSTSYPNPLYVHPRPPKKEKK